MLAAAGLSTGDIDLFAVASGPGMFTGLRIGIATIQGLAMVHGRRVAPISALRALAECGAGGLTPGMRVGAWMDAHRRDVFSALYRVEAHTVLDVARLTELDPPAVGTPASTLERWTDGNMMPALVCGDGAVLFGPVLPPHVRAMAAPPIAATIARLALVEAEAGRAVAPGGVRPLYVRRPDAEIARDAAARR